MAKEPWQMTQKEYAQYMSDTFEPIIFGASVGKKVRWRGTSEQAIAKQKVDVLRSVSEHHKYSIKQALKEGKPVPAEVLKDYPELKPTAEVPSGAIKIADEIDKLTGIEKTYWDAANEKLTIYYNPDTTMERARIEVNKYLADRQLQASVKQTVFLSTEKGTFKEAIPQAPEGMPTAEVFNERISQIGEYERQWNELWNSLSNVERLQWLKKAKLPSDVAGSIAERMSWEAKQDLIDVGLKPPPKAEAPARTKGEGKAQRLLELSKKPELTGVERTEFARLSGEVKPSEYFEILKTEAPAKAKQRRVWWFPSSL